jgi:quercetin dioxygenase-like cupin family protein
MLGRLLTLATASIDAEAESWRSTRKISKRGENMARVKIERVEDAKWTSLRETTNGLGPDELAKFGDGALDTETRVHHEGDASTLQLVEIAYKPNTVVSEHAHDEDEILVIVEGEAHIGKQTLRPGSSIFIAGNTLYGFSAGPGGLRLLNFRPRRDLTFITKDEFIKRRGAAQSPDSSSRESKPPATISHIPP